MYVSGDKEVCLCGCSGVCVYVCVCLYESDSVRCSLPLRGRITWSVMYLMRKTVCVAGKVFGVCVGVFLVGGQVYV